MFEEIARRRGQEFQNKIQGLFKKYNLGVDILDRNETNKRPDFFVYQKDNKSNGFICECKFIASGGIGNNGSYHISTLDPNLPSEEVFVIKEIRKKTKEDIEKALLQYNSLIKDKPEFSKFPFVVILGADFFADGFYSIPQDIYGLRDISAVMKIERNRKQKDALKEWPDEDLEKPMNGQKTEKKIPPESVRFEVLRNSNAKIKFRANIFLKNPIII